MSRLWIVIAFLALVFWGMPATYAAEEDVLKADTIGGKTEADEAVEEAKSKSHRERRLEALEIQAQLRLEEIKRNSEGIVTEPRLMQPLIVGTAGLTPTEKLNRRFKYDDPLRVRWALDLNDRRIVSIWMPPEGLDVQYALFFTDQNDLIAIHTHTGKPLWWTRTADKITGEPFFTKTHVYVTVRDYITMLERYTGQALWSVRLPFAPSAGPAAVEPKEGEPMLYLSGLDRTTYGVEIFREIWPPKGRMQALTRDDFQMEQFTPFVNWRFRTPGIVKTEAVYSQGRLIVGDWEGRIFGINTRSISGRTPKDFWVQRTAGAILTPALARGAFLYAPSSDRSLHCLSIREGSRFWRRILSGAITQRPQFLSDAHARKEYLMCSVGEGDAIYSLDPDNGKIHWQFDGGKNVIALFEDKEKPRAEKAVAVISLKDGRIVGIPVSKPFKVSEEQQEENQLAGRAPTPPTAWEISVKGFEPFAANSRIPYIITASEDGSVACALELNSFGK